MLGSSIFCQATRARKGQMKDRLMMETGMKANFSFEQLSNNLGQNTPQDSPFLCL